VAFDLLTRKQTNRDWSCGSILLPVKDQNKIFDKIDDLRYDLRATSTIVGAGIFALAGATAALAFGKIYKAAKG
jgi:hypothetical protein